MHWEGVDVGAESHHGLSGADSTDDSAAFDRKDASFMRMRDENVSKCHGTLRALCLSCAQAGSRLCEGVLVLDAELVQDIADVLHRGERTEFG